jgi:CoA-transferase family III
MVDVSLRYLPSAFDVDGLAVAAVSAALDGAADLAEARGRPRPRVSLDARHVACAFASERHLRGAPAAGFAPLSRFAPTRDGWIRLHANFPHHRRALLSALGADEERALDAIAELEAIELETAIVDAGGAAAAVRTREEWAIHPQGRAAGELLERVPVEAAPPRDREPLRVLDLTRVIAGPVATRFLAALGADVLRIDPPGMPDMGVEDTCSGKRLAELDLRRSGVEELLADADVVVQGYRPGALAAFGLDDAALAERHPHLVVASLAAWGWSGPWAKRRGFDSLVQAACGIAAAEGRDGRPGALPVQALDHATGYLMAAAVLRELAARWRGEPGAALRLSLAATAADLMRRPGGDGEPPDCEPFRLQLGELSVIGPPGALDGRPLTWAHPLRRDEPRWLG